MTFSFLQAEELRRIVEIGSKQRRRIHAQFLPRRVVSAIMEVTMYGSMLEAGLLSSKYPLPSFSVSLPTRMDAPRLATPCTMSLEINVNKSFKVLFTLLAPAGRGYETNQIYFTHLKVLMSAVSCFPVRRRSLPSP